MNKDVTHKLLSNSGMISFKRFIPSTIPIEDGSCMNNAKILSSRWTIEEKNNSSSFPTLTKECFVLKLELFTKHNRGGMLLSDLETSRNKNNNYAELVDQIH